MTRDARPAGDVPAGQPSSDWLSVRCFVSGRVHGVWFRASTAERAASLSLRGIVRNLADGRVEVLIGGDRSAVTQMIGWLWQGPELARVSGVDVEDCADALPEAFEVAPTL